MAFLYNYQLPHVYLCKSVVIQRLNFSFLERFLLLKLVVIGFDYYIKRIIMSKGDINKLDLIFIKV